MTTEEMQIVAIQDGYELREGLQQIFLDSDAGCCERCRQQIEGMLKRVTTTRLTEVQTVT